MVGMKAEEEKDVPWRLPTRIFSWERSCFRS
jgi:hypothetical protein